MKRFFALILCLVMVFSLLPEAAAEDIQIVEIEEPEELISLVEPADEQEQSTPKAEAVPNDKVAGGNCGDNVQWTLYSDGTLQLSGSGNMWNFNSSDPVPWREYCDSIKTLSIGTEITSIGNRAFAGCTKLKLDPASSHCLGYVTVIGYAAFSGCESLDYVFIPRTVTSIAENAFSGCTNLKRVTIAGNPSVGPAVFYGCSSLETVSLLSSLAPTFDDEAFHHDDPPWVHIYYPPNCSTYSACLGQNYGGDLSWTEGLYGWCGDDVTWELDEDGRLSIYGSGPTWALPSFREKTGSIRSAYVSTGVTSLNDYFFYTMSYLAEVSLPDCITEIGNYCFYGDPIRSIEIPAAVTKIGQSAFVNTDLTDIRFLGHPPTMAPSAFSGLSGVTAWYYPLHDWTEDAWSRVGGSIAWTCDDKIGTSVTWKLNSAGKLTLSGSGATWDYYDGHPGFWYVSDDCKSLSVASGVTELGEQLFYKLDELTSAAIPNTVTALGSYAFGNCINLEQLVFEGSAPSFGSSCFYNIRNLTAYYPATDTSWTDSVMKKYGADSISWESITKPTITTQPKSVSTTVGGTAKFTVAATGVGLSYQWQYRTSSTGSWYNSTASTAKSATFTVTAESYRNGYQYRCKVTNAAGSVLSNAATLTVTSISKPAITSHPKTTTVAEGETAKFTVAATGGALTYQWYYRTSASGTWTKCTGTGYNTATLSVKAVDYREGYQYRCLVKNSAGSIYTNNAALHILAKPAITTHPKTTTVAEGETVNFTVKATGGNLSYQWYYRTGSSGEWSKCTGTGCNTATLSVKAVAYREGYQYRCLVKNSLGSIYTNNAALHILAKPAITTQPASKTAAAGTTVKFTVAATGGNLTYQWYYRVSSTGTWTKCSGTGYNTATLSVEAKAYRSGYQYRCLVKNTAGEVYTNAVTLTVK